MKRVVAMLLFALLWGALSAEQIDEGWWTQTASTAGESDMIVAMKINGETPHIISLDSNNGWIGFAWYDEEEDQYAGFFELLRPESEPGRDDWTGEVFQVVLKYDGLTLTMNAQSSEREFHATYWKQ